MDREEKEPWRPHLDTLPLFNPFEPSTKWTAQIGAGDEIRIEDATASDDAEPSASTAEEVRPAPDEPQHRGDVLCSRQGK